MVKVYPVVGAIISLAALIILAIGASTNKWIILQQTNPKLNPTVVNSNLKSTQQSRLGITSSTTDISYMVSHYGLWFSCHREHRGALSCAFVGGKCHSNVCWIRQTTITKTPTCLKQIVSPIRNCVAYQFVRLFVVVATVLLLLGVCAQLVSVITVKRSLAMLAGIIVFASGLFVLVAFGIFYSEEWLKPALRSVAKIGWSFYLVIAAGPAALIGGVISCFAASMGLRHKEISDYSASNF